MQSNNLLSAAKRFLLLTVPRGLVRDSEINRSGNVLSCYIVVLVKTMVIVSIIVYRVGGHRVGNL